MDTNNKKQHRGSRLQFCDKCDKAKPVYSKDYMDGFICDDCVREGGVGEDVINEHVELGSIVNLIIREGYGEQIRQLEGMIKSPNERVANGYGGVKQYKDKLSRKLLYMRNRLMEVRPPNFPIKLYRKIRRRYKGNPEKGYKVMWGIHSKHGRKLKEMWGEFNNINEGITTGGLSESPDAVYRKDDTGTMVQTHEAFSDDARPFLIFRGILVLRGIGGTTHSDMLCTLTTFGRDLRYTVHTNDKNKYDRKMSIYNEREGNQTFYFSEIPKAEWFIDLYDSKRNTMVREFDSGRIWLNTNVVSFWKGCNRENVKKLLIVLKTMHHDPKGLSVEIQDKRTMYYTGEFTPEKDLKESPDAIYKGVADGGSRSMANYYRDDDARPFIIFDGILALRDKNDIHPTSLDTLRLTGMRFTDPSFDKSGIKFGVKMTLINNVGDKNTFYFSEIPTENWFIDFYRKCPTESDVWKRREYETGRVWLESKAVSFWNGCNKANVKLLMKTMKNMGITPDGMRVEKYDTLYNKHTGEFTPATELKESPDVITTNGSTIFWRDADARPFLIFNNVVIFRDNNETHGRLIDLLIYLGHDLVTGRVYSNIKYDKKMSIPDIEAGTGNKTVYFSKMPDEKFFIDIYNSRHELCDRKHDSGRVWLEKKMISFWQGLNKSNLKLLLGLLLSIGIKINGDEWQVDNIKTDELTPVTSFGVDNKKGLDESPDGINLRGVQSGWDAEDARPFIILNDIAVVRGKSESHADMLFKLKKFSSDIRNNEIDKSSIRYGKKMMIDGKAFYFSKVPTESFFHDFYVKYYIECKGLMSNLLEEILSGRIWLESNIISFWNGNNSHNIQLVAEALGLDVNDIHPEKKVVNDEPDLFTVDNKNE